MKKEQIIIKKYIISQRELKEKLGISGDIKSIELFLGLIPNITPTQKQKDDITFKIITHEEES